MLDDTEDEGEYKPRPPKLPAENTLTQQVEAFILGDESADLSGFPQTTRDNREPVYIAMQRAMRDPVYSSDPGCSVRLAQISRRVSGLPKPKPVKKEKVA